MPEHKRHVALLRGVNVGRAKRVAMAEWRDLLASLGYSDVRTLLNSGNAVFGAPAGSSVAHAARIRTALNASLGVDVQVVVKSASEFGAAVSANPLLACATDPSRLVVVFTQQGSALSALADHVDETCSPEALAVGKHAAYLWCPGGIAESAVVKLVDRTLGDRATARNWATVLKIQALLQDPVH